MRTSRSPSEQSAWERWLFEPHSRSELARWAPTLRVFRYCRAIGGHSRVDADELRAAFRVPTRAELERVLGALGATVTELPPDAPQPVPGRSYTGAEWAAFRRPTRGFAGLEQPGRLDVAGTPAFAWVGGDRLELIVSDLDHPWEVTDAAVAGARWIEPRLAGILDLVIDPPRGDEHCVCPLLHPEIWAWHRREELEPCRVDLAGGNEPCGATPPPTARRRWLPGRGWPGRRAGRAPRGSASSS